MLQGPLENDLVVHVALIAESQRYEIHVGGVFLGGTGDDCFILTILSMAIEINFIDPLDVVLSTSLTSLEVPEQHSFHV